MVRRRGFHPHRHTLLRFEGKKRGHMRILEYMQNHGYEQLVACHDPSVGLKAFIAIYDTSLGPALGGVRLWPWRR
jgi:glutamate dehydrogenase/leucine dehydrogenase